MPSLESTASRERALAKLLPHNGLLAALPEDVQHRLLPHLGLVDLRAGQRLLEESGVCVRVFFPLAGLVSLAQVGRDGSLFPVALVGSEGMLGLPLVTGEDDRPMRATVEGAGYGLALGREPLINEWQRGGAFNDVLLRYSNMLQGEMARQLQCRRDHTALQRLGALLLAMSLDRPGGRDAALTVDRAASLLALPREALAHALRTLREHGVLAVRPEGAITVADRAALQAKACNCHGRIREQQQRLMFPAQEQAEPLATMCDQSRINASISSGLTGTPREISSQPLSVTIASSSMRMPML